MKEWKGRKGVLCLVHHLDWVVVEDEDVRLDDDGVDIMVGN